MLKTGLFLTSVSRATLATSVVLAGLAAGVATAQETPEPVQAGNESGFTSRIVTAGLEYPWAMEWGPDGQIWVTEREGKRVTRVDPYTGETQELLTIDEVFVGPQHEGLLGMALHPELGQGTGNDYVYLNYTYNVGDSDALENRRAKIVRYTYNAETERLEDPMELIAGIPAGDDHNGGRLVIGEDMKLYYSKGEGGHNFGRNLRRPNEAQRLPTADEVADADWSAYWGKVLRMNLDGSIPEDNPEIDGVKSHIFTYGHRNPQGLAFGPNGTLYEDEHGPSTDDEVNILEAGGNYGWPNVAGFQDDQAYEYINWSEAPEDVEQGDELPDSVPQFQESEFDAENFHPPLATFWTVTDDYDFEGNCGWICNPTIAPSSLAYYDAGEDGIEAWDNSLLIPTLKHGSLYVLPLNEDGTEVDGEVTRYFNTQNRYRDILVSEDGRDIFIATDPGGTSAQLFGDTGYTNVLHNPGAIMLFSYEGDNTEDPAAAGGDARPAEEGMAGQSGSSASSDDAERAPRSEGEAMMDRAQDEPSDEAEGAEGDQTEANGDEAAADDAASTETAALDMEAMISRGNTIFSRECSVCHGSSGGGGQGPALSGNENVGDTNHVVNVLLNGYGYMPPFGDRLDDEEIASALTFVRNSWGNEFGPVSPDEVAAER